MAYLCEMSASHKSQRIHYCVNHVKTWNFYGDAAATDADASPCNLCLILSKKEVMSTEVV